MSSCRRDFLKTTGFTAASTLTAASLTRPLFAGTTVQEKVHLGIIGCGGIMNLHVKGLVSRSENVSLVPLPNPHHVEIARLARVHMLEPRRDWRQPGDPL